MSKSLIHLTTVEDPSKLVDVNCVCLPLNDMYVVISEESD